MDTSEKRAGDVLPSSKARQGLTDAKLRDLQPRERPYKVTDGGSGLYVVVSPGGSRSFRYAELILEFLAPPGTRAAQLGAQPQPASHRTAHVPEVRRAVGCDGAAHR